MIWGLGYGSLVACCWGICDVMSMRLMRGMGVLRLCLLTQPVGVLVLALVGLLALWQAPAQVVLPDGRTAAIIALLSLGLAVFYFLGLAGVYRALASGPLSVVSPIISAQGAISLAIAIFVLGEQVNGEQLLLLLCMIAGVMLLSFSERPTLAGLGSRRAGIIWALIAMFCMGVLNAGIGVANVLAGMAGMYWLVFGYRLCSVLLAFLAFVVLQPERSTSRSIPVLTVVIGMLETLGLIVFTLAISNSNTAIAGVLASLYPFIPFLYGVLYMRERPQQLQMVGALLLIGANVLLPLAHLWWLVFLLPGIALAYTGLHMPQPTLQEG